MTMWVISRIFFSFSRDRIWDSSMVLFRLLDDELFPFGVVEGIGDGEDILVTTAGLVDQDDLVGGHRRRLLEGTREGMGRFQGRDDPLLLHGQTHRRDHFLIRGAFEAHAPLLLEVGEDRRHAHVIQTGGNGVGLAHLAVGVLQKVSLVPLGHAHAGVGGAKPCGMLTGGKPPAGGLHAHQFDVVVKKAAEDAHGVGTATHAGVNPGGQSPFPLHELPAGLLADDGLEPGHHLGKGVRPTGRAEHVMGIVHVGHPVAKGLVDGVLEDAGPVGHRHDGGPQLLHPEDVGPLTFHIHGTHVNRAIESETRRHGGRGHAVLAGAGFGDHARLAHAFDQQALAHHIVGLVGAGVIQILALDKNACPAEVARQVPGIGNGRGPAGIAGHQLLVVVPEYGIVSGLGINPLEFVERGNQDLGQKRPAEVAEIAASIHDLTLQSVGRKRIAGCCSTGLRKPRCPPGQSSGSGVP
ncbi:hypothetical protein DESC_490016 [Desulfosarcina cetonica]|nr:hypothetical protein DESC_490016 [Desulfosarcina cetonica]